MTRILGVIPARGGSVRIPRKNLQVVGGMTLVERAAQCALGAKLLDCVVVSTDDDETADVVRAMNPKVWGRSIIRRKCAPDGPMVEVLRDALEQVGGEWDAVVTIQPSSPLRTREDIDECVERFKCIARVRRGYGMAVVTADAGSVREGAYRRNGAVYVTPYGMLLDGLVFRGGFDDHPVLMPASRSLDINTLADLEEARRLLGP